jgi:hypothetical protein
MRQAVLGAVEILYIMCSLKEEYQLVGGIPCLPWDGSISWLSYFYRF